MLVQLGLSGVGKYSFQPTKYGLTFEFYRQAKQLRNGGLGN